MLIEGDCLEVLPTLESKSIQCVVTSPPYYGLRDYGVTGQIGLEKTPEEYVEKMVAVFREVKRVLRDDGMLWLNLGSSYAGGGNGCHGKGWENDEKIPLGPSPKLSGFKPKDLIPIPWMVAMALQADGWYLRQDIIWSKPNPMPESVTDRCTKSHEYIFLLTKQAKYFYDAEAVKEPNAGDLPWGNKKNFKMNDEGAQGKHGKGMFSGGSKEEYTEKYYLNGRNRRSVWTITTKPFKEAHFATFPPEIPEICIRAGTSEKGCCPECGNSWVRMLNRVAGTSTACPKEQLAHEARGGAGLHTGTVGKSGSGRINGGTETTGWHPTCSHNLEPVPCVVLDPFSGAGTTILVAERLGRKGIGIEINPSYVGMSKTRVYNDAPLFAEDSYA